VTGSSIIKNRYNYNSGEGYDDYMSHGTLKSKNNKVLVAEIYS